MASIRPLHDAVQPLEDLALACHDALAFGASRRPSGTLAQLAAEHAEGPPGQVADGLVQRSLVELREGLPAEVRQVGFRGQGDVQLRRAAAQQRGRLQVRAEHRFRQARGRLGRQLQQRLPGQQLGGQLRQRLLREDVLEIAIHGVQGVAPGVALVVDVALQDADGDRGPPRHEILDRPGQRRGVRKGHVVREEGLDLQLGIDSLLQPAEDLQEELVAVEDGAVALLGLRSRRSSRARRPASRMRWKRREGRPASVPFAAVESPPARRSFPRASG